MEYFLIIYCFLLPSIHALLRDDSEWLQYRKVLNPMLLRDFSHYKLSIETACDKLIDGINDGDDDDNIAANIQDKSLRDTEFVEWRDLEASLYRWSIDGEKCDTIEQGYSNQETFRHKILLTLLV